MLPSLTLTRQPFQVAVAVLVSIFGTAAIFCSVSSISVPCAQFRQTRFQFYPSCLCVERSKWALNVTYGFILVCVDMKCLFCREFQRCSFSVRKNNVRCKPSFSSAFSCCTCGLKRGASVILRRVWQIRRGLTNGDRRFGMASLAL